MKMDKDDMIALAGTVAAHILAALLLLFTALRTIIPEEEEGVPVNIGYTNDSAGLFEPRGGSSQRDAGVPEPPASTSAPARHEETISQDMEESVAIAERRRAEEQRRREEREHRERERLEAERRRQEAERQQREQAIRDEVSGAFGSGNTASGSQGNSEGAGNQGSPFGNSDTGANQGIGGMGEFSLSGRVIRGGGRPPEPAYTTQDEGRIVIDITVDPQGNVIVAEIGRGTNIDNASLRSSALDAARRAKFNSISGTNNQSGTITYRYKLK
ncbi:MAG: energy transducer TonB [Tannerella sp.]|nr:energy transducer TonB [Tannerella sp.]